MLEVGRRTMRTDVFASGLPSREDWEDLAESPRRRISDPPGKRRTFVQLANQRRPISPLSEMGESTNTHNDLPRTKGKKRATLFARSCSPKSVPVTC
jgi:hypothetical protein